MKNKVYNLSIYSTVPDEAQKELENLTPLHFAAKYGDAMFITTTIAALDDSQKKSIINKQLDKVGKFTPLHFAARYGNIGVIEVLLKEEAAVDLLTSQQELPIQSAFSSLNDKDTTIKIFNLLNTNKSSLKHKNFNGDTVAHLAAEKNILEILTILKKEDPSVFNEKNNQSRTPLLVAIMNNAPLSTIKLFLDTSSVQVKDNTGRNALHYAVLYSTEECVSLLTPYIDIHATDNEKLTPQDYAIKNMRTLKI